MRRISKFRRRRATSKQQGLPDARVCVCAWPLFPPTSELILRDSAAAAGPVRPRPVMAAAVAADARALIGVVTVDAKPPPFMAQL